MQLTETQSRRIKRRAREEGVSMAEIIRRCVDRGLDLLLDRPRRCLSLVDAVSFAAMRARRVDRAFAFDRDFERDGFEVVD